MRRLKDGLLSLKMEVGNGLHVWQDASGDHEGQHVYGDEQDRAHREGDQKTLRNLKRLNRRFRSELTRSCNVFSKVILHDERGGIIFVDICHRR